MANADTEAMDFEPEDDDLMDDDIDASPCAAHPPKLKSTITGGVSSFSSAPKKTKGRGFHEVADADRQIVAAHDFDSLDSWIECRVGLFEERKKFLVIGCLRRFVIVHYEWFLQGRIYIDFSAILFLQTRLEGICASKAGPFAVVVEIFEVAPSLFMVDVWKVTGYILEYHKVTLTRS
ncbi:hypothetical protein K2173_026787 [Erythroxylum novogranatense]|uniref:Uncharacterized protein n=1 Tax=Erythroxylum novogranatense TaxID=1862640 RepID=A0AAV8TXA7_9ROSI|nr:hypothetical protein K2173_026787 [Erythroxylum novogranatense]